tara:strand:- start:5277 stop:5717 length:441 start_codon:yes stop_codon:yes gene_type:complete
MENGISKYSYVEWFSSDEIYENITLWQSELNFIKNEQLFLNELVQLYVPQLSEKLIVEKSENVIALLKMADKELDELYKMVQTHKNQLEIMMDHINQFKMEKAYLQKHKELIMAMKSYSENYRTIKSEIFKIIATVMKKNKGLINN